MRKVFTIMLVAAVMSTVVFAQEESAKKPSWFSVGIGGFIGSDFSGGGAELFNHSSQSAPGYTARKQIYPYFGGGGFLFIDVKYAELSLGFFGGSGTSKDTSTWFMGYLDGDYVDSESKKDMSYTSFNIGLLLKYPFGKTDKFKFFPLLGMEYQVMLSAKGNGKVPPPGDFSALWIKAGIGFDVAITTKIYARLEALYGVRTPNKVDDDMTDQYEKYAKPLRDQNQNVDVSTLAGHGLTVNLAVGYRF